jgi:hypothetical protein
LSNSIRQTFWQAKPLAIVIPAIVLVLLIVALNLYLALLERVSVPIVDGWPVLHRIMLLENGEISWRRYLLSPHGAHMHAIIYFVAWLDFQLLGGQQELQTAVSLLAVTIYTLFIAGLLAWEGTRQGRRPVEIIFVALAASALLSGLSDMESLLVPFQAVLSVSRLTYIVLLWALCVAIQRNRPSLYAIVILAAIPAVTFHGTGQLFGFCIILVHLLLRQGAKRLAIACLPMLCALAVQSYYSVGGGELSQLGQVLTPSALVEVPLAFAAYFSTPFIAFLHMVDNRLFLVPGALLACSTIVLTLLGLRISLGLHSWSPAAWWRQYRAPAADRAPTPPGVVIFTIIGLLLLMSGLAASLFWFVRVPPGMPAWQPVQSTARYGAYATLAYLMPLAVFLHVRRDGARARTGLVRWMTASGALSLLAIAVMALGLLGSWRVTVIHVMDDRLNIALSGISAGLSPILPQTEDIWPQVGTDWYWKTEVPRTVGWLRGLQSGPWRDLPVLGAQGGAAYAAYPLTVVTRQPLPANVAPGHCRVSATLPSWGRKLPQASTVVPITHADGIVAGYGTLTRRSAHKADRVLEGFMLCPPGDTGSLFIARDESH